MLSMPCASSNTGTGVGLPYIVKPVLLNKLIKGGLCLLKEFEISGEEVAIVEVKVEGELNSSIRRTFTCTCSGFLRKIDTFRPSFQQKQWAGTSSGTSTLV